MGDTTAQKMRVLINYLKSKVKLQFKKLREWLNVSRFILGVVMLTIGITGNFIHEHYQDFQIVKTIRIEIVEAYQGEGVQATSYQATGNSISAKVDEEGPRVSAPASPQTIAEKIYYLESTNGKNNYSKCEAIGKINGIGYGIPGNGKYQCFESHEDEMQVLIGWIIDKKSKGMSEKELLCLYSGSNYEICK